MIPRAAQLLRGDFHLTPGTEYRHRPSSPGYGDGRASLLDLVEQRETFGLELGRRDHLSFHRFPAPAGIARWQMVS